MKKKTTNQLLSNYMINKLSEKEFLELRKRVNSSDNDALEEELAKLWSSHKAQHPIYKKRADVLFYRIKHHIHQTRIHRYLLSVQTYAAIFIIALLSSVCIYLYQDHRIINSLVEQEVVFTAPKGQQAYMTLPDGTSVHLNSNSKLSYKRNFGQKNRKISFSGEGLFKVARNIEKKFLIETKDLRVEVLGTTFNFYTYEDTEDVELALIKGKVKVTTLSIPKQTKYIKANEIITLNRKTGKLSKTKTANAAEFAWTQNTLIFNAIPLRKVIEKLSHKFNKTIHLQNNVMTRDLYTATYKNKTLDEILRILKVHYHFKIRRRMDEIYISFDE